MQTFALPSAPSNYMDSPSLLPPPAQAAAAGQAYGRCIGVFFFAFFGAAWLSYALVALHLWSAWTAALLGGGVLALLLPAVFAMRQLAPLAKRARTTGQQRNLGRVFALVNVLQWAAIIAVAKLLPQFHHPELVIPAIVLIVGLHLFPLAYLFRHRTDYVTGSVLVAWAVLCATVFPEPARDILACAGTGLTLWVVAAYSLSTARQQARQVAG